MMSAALFQTFYQFSYSPDGRRSSFTLLLVCRFPRHDESSLRALNPIFALSKTRLHQIRNRAVIRCECSGQFGERGRGLVHGQGLVSHKCVLAFRTVKRASGCRTQGRGPAGDWRSCQGVGFFVLFLFLNTPEATSNALCFFSLSPDFFLFSFSSPRLCQRVKHNGFYDLNVVCVLLFFVCFFYYISFVYLRPV